MLLSELTEDQKSHLAWRLDHNTGCGFITATSVARGVHGDLDIVEIFEKYGFCSKRSAKALAKKVEAYKVDPKKKTIANLTLRIFPEVLHRINQDCDLHRLENEDYAQVMENVADALVSSAKLYRVK